MTPEYVVQLVHGALMAAFSMSAPLLGIGLGVAIVMNLVQIATSLQDNAFSTMPRLAAFLVGFTVLMPWMLKQWMTYTIGICGEIAHFGH